MTFLSQDKGWFPWMCSVFCFQDNDPEGSANSASSHCVSSEFTEHQLHQDSQSGTGSAASGSGSALFSSLDFHSNDISSYGTGREVQDLDVCYSDSRWLASMLVICNKMLGKMGNPSKRSCSLHFSPALSTWSQMHFTLVRNGNLEAIPLMHKSHFLILLVNAFGIRY